MDIIYSKNAVEKFSTLSKHGFNITKKDTEKVLSDPEHIDIKTSQSKIIGSRSINKTHVLRVVYRVRNDIIKIITFYPAEKENLRI